MAPADEGGRKQPPERPDRPDYKVYRARRSPLRGLRSPDLARLRDRKRPKKPRGTAKTPSERPRWVRVVKWIAIAAAAWILLSFLAFAISSQIQKGKLANGVTDELHGNPFLLASPQTILVLGTDIRSGAFAGPDEAASKKCLDAAGSGEAPADAGCEAYRSDTIMLVRVGGGTFRKLSIPRDTFAAIPGQDPQKINAGYAFGGAKLEIQTIEQFLGIDIDQVAIVDFDGFRKFIDTIGGVSVDVPTKVCSTVSGGAFNLFLDPGEHTLDGFQAITLARTRENAATDPDGDPCPPLSDIDRVRFQQLILQGIKNRLTSPLRLPYNFIKGPIIGWTAPQALVSSMGALNMPELVLAVAIGGDEGTEVLKPSATTPTGDLIVAPEECERAVKKLLGEPPPRTPACSPQ